MKYLAIPFLAVCLWPMQNHSSETLGRLLDKTSSAVSLSQTASIPPKKQSKQTPPRTTKKTVRLPFAPLDLAKAPH